MTEPPVAPVAEEDLDERHWYDRIGIITGVVLFVVTVVALAVLAAIGFTPALYLLVLFAVGTFMIAQGARMRGPHRSRS